METRKVSEVYSKATKGHIDIEFQKKLLESNQNRKVFHIQEKASDSCEYDPIGSAINFDEKNSKNCLDAESFLIEIFKNDHLLNFEDKLNISKIVFAYFTQFGYFDEFFEEECHLAMVNWIYKYIKNLEKEPELDIPSRFYDLIINILNIFEILPIKVADLFSLNIYEKLNKFRKIIKNKDFIICQKLDRLLCYWSSFNFEKSFLNRKKIRIEIENENENENENKNKNEFEKQRGKKSCFEIEEKTSNKSENSFISDKSQNSLKLQNMRNSYTKDSVYKSSILKSEEKKIKKSVKWKREEEINQVNIFKYYDPPCAGAISQEEYEYIHKFLTNSTANNSNPIDLEIE